MADLETLINPACGKRSRPENSTHQNLRTLLGTLGVAQSKYCGAAEPIRRPAATFIVFYDKCFFRRQLGPPLPSTRVRVLIFRCTPINPWKKNRSPIGIADRNAGEERRSFGL